MAKPRTVKIRVKNNKLIYSKKKKTVYAGDTLSFDFDRAFALLFLMNDTPLDSGTTYLSGPAGTVTVPELIKDIPKKQKPKNYEYVVAVYDNGTVLLDDPIIIIDDGGGGTRVRTTTKESRKKSAKK